MLCCYGVQQNRGEKGCFGFPFVNEHSSDICSIGRKHIGLNSTAYLRNKGLHSCVHMHPLSLTRELVNHSICFLFLVTVITVISTGHHFSLQSTRLFPSCRPERLLQPSALQHWLTKGYCSLSLVLITMTNPSLSYLFHSQGRGCKSKSWMLPSTLFWTGCEWELPTSEGRSDGIPAVTLRFCIVAQPKQEDCDD